MGHNPLPEPGIKFSSRTLGQSWMAVPARTRLKFSAAMVAMATIGIFASNYLEERLPVPPKSNQKST